MRRFYVIGLLAIVFSSLTSLVHAQTSESKSLKGLGVVTVRVEPLAPVFEAEGLTHAKLQAAAESRLRRNKIPVRRYEDAGSWSLPTVSVKVSMAGPDSWRGLFYAADVSVSLRTIVTVNSTNELVLFGSVWDRATLFLLGRSYVVSSLTKEVENIIDQFSNAYLTVNPG